MIEFRQRKQFHNLFTDLWFSVETHDISSEIVQNYPTPFESGIRLVTNTRTAQCFAGRLLIVPEMSSDVFSVSILLILQHRNLHGLVYKVEAVFRCVQEPIKIEISMLAI
uniref:Uncharacterized protein n=1 Tax=Lutzomyia longipalpis TaxID=7200 RepID=A0A1B0CMN4_LUTLO